jgi:hypothetical protein
MINSNSYFKKLLYLFCPVPILGTVPFYLLEFSLFIDAI